MDDAPRGPHPGGSLTRVRLRSGVRVLRRGLGEMQIGTDRRWAVRIDGLSSDEMRALEAIGEGAAVDVVADDPRVDRARLGALVEQLTQAGLTERTARRATTGPAGADADVLSLLRPEGDGDRTVAARADRAVGVVGLGSTGLGVAATLAAAGVGRVLLEDPRPVRSADVGPSGYRWQDVGRPRARAAAAVVTGIAPAVVTELATSDEPSGPAAPLDLVVVVSDDALDPALAARLVNRGTAHLSIVVREADTVVGPLVVPGRGPCLRCLDLHRRDADAAWPVLAAALATTRSARAAPPEPAAVASVASGLAAAAALAHVDDPDAPGRLLGSTLELSLPDALPRERRWAAHPACGCTAHASGESAGVVRQRGACADGPDRAWSGRQRHR